MSSLKLGIMQPYFFPYLGYFQLMNSVDRWIVFDDIQFIDKGWINRNRILHPEPVKEWQFITLPLENRGQFDKICDITIASNEDWRAQILGKLTCYRRAPYYKQTIDFLRDCFDTNETNLAKIVTSILIKTARHIQIDTPIDIQSKMNLTLGKVDHPGHWALKISQVYGAKEYVNPYGGVEIFSTSEFTDAGIRLSFLKAGLIPYPQHGVKFIAGLSIIDVLMFNSLSQINILLDQCEVISSDTMKSF